MTSPIRLVIVDDHAIVREGVRVVLDDAVRFQILAEGSNGDDAIAQCKDHQPDVLLLDITMPGESGLRVVPQVLQVSPDTRILMLSVHDDREYVTEAVRVGAHGYLRKDSTPTELRAAVESVHRGDAFFSPQVARHVASALRESFERRDSSLPPTPPPSVLTPREKEVLASIAAGLSNKEIAAELAIAVRTVEAHRDSLSKKLGIRNVAALTRYCLEHGIQSRAPE